MGGPSSSSRATSLPRKPLSSFAPILIFSLITYSYVVYLLMVLLPQLKRLNYFQHSNTPLAVTVKNDPHMYPASEGEVLGFSIPLHFFFLLFLFSFLQAFLTPPGSVPIATKKDSQRWERGEWTNEEMSLEEEEEIERIVRDLDTDLRKKEVKEFLKRMPIVERKKPTAGATREGEGEQQQQQSSSSDSSSQHFHLPNDTDRTTLRRKCHGCCVYKPDRTHHCSVCGVCVLRMDHHCPWISNCVGFHNYKFFYLVLLYGLLSLTFLLLSMYGRFRNIWHPILDTMYFVKKDLHVGIVFIFASFLALLLFGFFIFHTYLILNSMTTIEYREKKSHSNPDIFHRWRVAHVKFHDRESVVKNIRHVLGPEVWMWLIPVSATEGDDGTYTNGAGQERREKEERGGDEPGSENEERQGLIPGRDRHGHDLEAGSHHHDHARRR